MSNSNYPISVRFSYERGAIITNRLFLEFYAKGSYCGKLEWSVRPSEVPLTYNEFALRHRNGAFVLEAETDPNVEPFEMVRIGSVQKRDHATLHCNENCGRGLWEAFQEFGFEVVEVSAVA